MDQMLGMSLGLHVGFAIIVLVVAIGHVGMILSAKEYKWLFGKIHWWIPAYYFLLSAMFFTGLIAWTVLHFKLSFWVVIMLLAWMLMLGGSIMAYKRFKLTKTSSNPKYQENFKSFALKKYIFDCALIIGLYLGAS